MSKRWGFQRPDGGLSKRSVVANTRVEARARIKELFGVDKLPPRFRIWEVKR